MKFNYCVRCNIYLPNNKVIRVWNNRKEKGEWLCKNCCIDSAVNAEIDMEYTNKFNDEGEVIL